MRLVSMMTLSLIVLPLIFLVSVSAETPTAAPAPGTPTAAIPGLATFQVPSARHVAGPVVYPQNPPAGGPHNPVWQTCGFYDTPVANEHAVHSQEHGAIWITYRPDLPADQIALLRQLTERSDYVLVSPYPNLPAPVVASAWGKQLRLDGADDPRLRRFIRLYAGKGPERGAPCVGGTTDTGPLVTGAPPAGTPTT